MARDREAVLATPSTCRHAFEKKLKLNACLGFHPLLAEGMFHQGHLCDQIGLVN